MNLSALPELLLAWVKSQGAGLLQGDKAQSVSFQPGAQYQGKVVDQLASGRHLVKVDNQLLDMNLPAKTRVGDSVKLTYLNAGPRPTFLLDQAPITPVKQVQISTTAHQVNALLRLAQGPSVSTPLASATSVAQPEAMRGMTAKAEMPGAPVASARTSGAAATPGASPGAQTGAATAAPLTGMPTRPIVANVLMLQNYAAAVQSMTTTLTGPKTGLLGQAIDAPRAMVSASTTLSANTLVELPSSSRHALPARLSQTVSESGMFYESHLAKWNRGTMSLESIMREPQARLSQDSQLVSRLSELDGMPEGAARMAGRQLQMLEGAPFLWQGLAWPGQAMEWQVREEGHGEGQGDADAAASEWVTELNLTLPQLGEVRAQLGLAGDRLRLRLQAETPATRDVLAAALPSLEKSLALNGLQAVDSQIEVQPVESGNGRS